MASTTKNAKQNVAEWERLPSVLGGTALIVAGLRAKSPAGFAIAAVGGGLVARGVTGQDALYQALGVTTMTQTTDGVPSQAISDEPEVSNPDAAVKHKQGHKAVQAVTVNKPRHELYQYWRKLENLPSFMKHLVSVTVLDETRSRWVATAPLGQTVTWDAEIINEVENELIAWKSTEGAQIQNAGSVRFKDAPTGRGTIVTAEVNYAPPAGVVGKAIATLFGEEPKKQIYDDMKRFEQIMEAGEVASTDGQPAGAGRSK